MLNLFYYDFGAKLIKPDPNIYYRTAFLRPNAILCSDRKSNEIFVIFSKKVLDKV